MTAYSNVINHCSLTQPLISIGVQQKPLLGAKFATMNKLAVLFFTLLLSFSSNLLFAQQPPNLGCKDTSILKQGMEIKKHYTDQGFTVYRDAMIGMESRIPYPVIMQMNRGDLYVIVFIGSKEARRLDMDLYEPNEVVIQKINVQRNRDQPNYIIHTFSPTYSGQYLAVALQKWKDKSMCGSFFVLKMDGSKNKGGMMSVVPFNNF